MQVNTTARFSDSFWGTTGTEYNGEYAGFEVLDKRLHEGKNMGEAFVLFCEKRQELERAYGQAMVKLAGSISHRDNHGELKRCWDSMMAAMHQIGHSHLSIADGIEKECLPRLKEFNVQQRQRRKVAEDSYRKKNEKRMKAYEKVQRTQKGYVTKCKEHDSLETLVKSPPPNMTAKEVEKAKSKQSKAKSASEAAEIAYQEAVRSHKEVQNAWEADFVSLCDTAQDLEEERVICFKDEITNVTNMGLKSASEDQGANSSVSKALENLDLNQEIQMLIRHSSTGQTRLAPVVYKDYYNPDVNMDRQISNSNIKDLPVPGGMAVPAGMATVPVAGGGSKPLPEPKPIPTPTPAADIGETFMEYRALYDYPQQSEAELSFSVGDYLQVVSKEEDPWWEAVLDGERGMVYSEFLVASADFDEVMAQMQDEASDGDYAE